MTLKPLADSVLLKATEAEETTKSGIILSTASKEKPVVSEVVPVRSRRVGLYCRTASRLLPVRSRLCP